MLVFACARYENDLCWPGIAWYVWLSVVTMTSFGFPPSMNVNETGGIVAGCVAPRKVCRKSLMTAVGKPPSSGKLAEMANHVLFGMFGSGRFANCGPPWL